MTSLTIETKFGIKAMNTEQFASQTMLLVFCLFGVLVSVALGAPAPGELVVVPGGPGAPVSSSTVEPVPILSAESDVDPSGNYKYR